MSATETITAVRSKADELKLKILSRATSSGVVGLGYVGLPLAVELGRAGFQVTGLDCDRARVEQIRAGQTHIADLDLETFNDLLQGGSFQVTNNSTALSTLDTVSICVPTPLRKTQDPDLSAVVAVSEQLAERLHDGMLVILESTTYPGTTEELIRPILERTGLRAGEDFFLCFSPERVDPANPAFHTRNIPKVIGGITPQCAEIGALFYRQVMDRVVTVSSTRVAEMVKLLENTFRMINIGLANEMALLCDRMEIDVWEVIEAAATKPFGFMPFYPGPGLGGHCIPVDPFYLSWKSKQAGREARFIDLAGQINRQMPHFVVAKIQNALNDQGKAVRGSRIHIIGVAYKKDVADTRESPALDIISSLETLGAKVTFTDPWVPFLRLGDREVRSIDSEPACAEADCVVIVSDHSAIDYRRLAACSRLIIDTRNRLKGVEGRIVRL